VLTAHKGQPRIEALFTLYFLALLVQALIERELRQGLQQAQIDQLPLYPEARACRRPTTEHILRLFSLAERVSVLAGEQIVRVFPPTLTELQRQVLRLLGVPASAYLAST